MQIDPWILAFSAVTVIATIGMGFWSAKRSKTAGDFFVAGRSVSVGWNASAISGEYLSAASFMGVAGMVMSSGYDALWYPVCYACGYLFLLLFIAGPLRRFGAYTIPDFAEGRFDSPVFRKIAVVFVLFIGFFYTMPQMKGAGTTLAYIFPGLPYWVGVVLVGAVITLNVAMGGMKGITLVQAFQYWIKMFAISVPVFVLMLVYGHYGRQVGVNAQPSTSNFPRPTNATVAALDVEHSLYRTNGAELSWLTNTIQAPPLSLAPAPSSRGSSATALFLTPKGAAELMMNPDVIPTSNLLSIAESKSRYLFVKLGDKNVKMPAAAAKLVFDRQLSRFARAELKANIQRQPLPDKAPLDDTWLHPFGPLTTKAAKKAAAAIVYSAPGIALRAGLSPGQRMTVNLDSPPIAQALAVYAELTGRQLLPNTNSVAERVDELLGGKLSQLKLVSRMPAPDSGIREHGDGAFTAVEVKTMIEAQLRTNGIALAPVGERGFIVQRAPGILPSPGAQKAWLANHEKPLALLYTYSLIIALVCGTAGLPHILVRFYTNPDGVAAKRTTMWVMILIGVFYLFPPVIGVMGRNLLPDLYAGVGAKGTDKVVLELPRVLDSHSSAHSLTGSPSGAVSGSADEPVSGKKRFPWGSILSGVTCAGAFAAFMSTFSGLLVSMTGALAHDVYGRMLRPQATPEQRMRMFKWCAVVVGGLAVLLGMQVEPLQINFMVGQAFAIAAASYFPLLFVSVWWRKLTMKGAATGMLTGGTLALAGISLTSFTDLKWLPLDAFWAAHPLLRILCEQPAIWAVPLAIGLMVIVSKLTSHEVPADIRMKMLVLHAPEKLGLKQEYIQEQQMH